MVDNTTPTTFSFDIDLKKQLKEYLDDPINKIDIKDVSQFINIAVRDKLRLELMNKKERETLSNLKEQLKNE